MASSLNISLLDAVVAGDLTLIRGLVQEGADPDARSESGQPSLCDACEFDHAEALRLLLELGADPNAAMANGWTPLHHAIDAEGDFRNQAGKSCDMRLIGPLLEAGADVNALHAGQTPLDLAVGYQHEQAVVALRQRGARRATDL